MRVQAITKNFRMSPQKMREVVRQIQGLPALQAQAVLAIVPRKSARVVAKTLNSAIANAENNNDLKAENLVVLEAVAGDSRPRPAVPPARSSSAVVTSRSFSPMGRTTKPTRARTDFLWVKSPIRLVSASPSTRTGGRSGMRTRRSFPAYWRRIARSAGC